MNISPLVDVNDIEILSEMKSIMKKFNCMGPSNNIEIKNVSDVQNILEEGRVEDLTKCIQSILNYSFNTYANDSAVKIIDPSFIKFFHVAQFIIRFLLHWKNELLTRNSKFKIQCQELDRLRKECFARKMENKELKKQFIKSQQTISSGVSNNNISECQKCQKVFINSTFLYAHHKKRHPDLPFSNFRSLNEMQTLRDEIEHLKYQLKKVSSRNKNESKSSEVGETKTESTLKMILTPESGCLEAQEKFWRGKLKELQRSLDELTAENSSLKEQLARLKSTPTSAVAVQTEFSYLKLRNSINDFLSTAEEKTSVDSKVDPLSTCNKISTSVPVTRTYTNTNFVYNHENMDPVHLKSKLFMAEKTSPSSAFAYDMFSSLSSARLHSPLLRNQKHDFIHSSEVYSTNTAAQHSHRKDSLTKNLPDNESSFLLEKPDVVEEVDSFLQNYEKLKNKNYNRDDRQSPEKFLCEKVDRSNQNNDVQQVITKLFTADPNSELLADKLIKIYERRRSLVTDDDVSDTGVEKLTSDSRLRETEARSMSSHKTKDFLNCNNFSTRNDGQCEGAKQPRSAADSGSEVVNKQIEVVVEQNRPKNHGGKLRILPFFRNIPLKIIKNYTKSRKTCASIIESREIRKAPVIHPKEKDNSSNATNIHHVNEQTSQTQNQVCEREKNDSCLPKSNTNIDLNEHKLRSAMKKSKSTGNITKKVAFMDELATFKTASESDLRKITNTILHRKSNEYKSKVVSPVDTVLHDKLDLPIPAPRSKKNIASNKNFRPSLVYEEQTLSLQEVKN